QDLYRSRQGVDPRYARIAQQMDDQLGQGVLNPSTTISTGSEALDSQRILQQEREWTRADGSFAVDSVPDRPPVAADTRLLVEELQFRSPRAGMNRVWINAVVEAEQLTPTRTPAGGFRYRVEARWILVDEVGESVTYNSAFETTTPRRLGRDESLPVRLAADLSPGQYRYAFLVRDTQIPAGKKQRSGNYRRADLSVRELSAGAPALSDVAVAADSGGAWSPGGGIRLRPSPAHLTGADGVAFVYYEVYNLTPGGQYTIRIRLEPQDDDADPFELSFPSDGMTDFSRRSRRLIRLDLSDTDPGWYMMEVTITDEETGISTLPHYTPVTVNRSVP
ncbi:MAG: hypothetical protein KAI98_05205, partial [Gemmatimonadetes bacterium]|nr:hypothetical protein [Gemmatimonadota bacterium]